MYGFKYEAEEKQSVIDDIIRAFGMTPDPLRQEVKRYLSEDELSVIAETSKEKCSLTLEFIDSIETRKFAEFLGECDSSSLKNNFTGSRLTLEEEKKSSGTKEISVVETKSSITITIDPTGTREQGAEGFEDNSAKRARDIADKIRHIMRTEWVFEPPRPTTYPDWPLDPQSAPKGPWQSHFMM